MALALSIPLVDTSFTMLRRGVLQRRSIFAAERGHVHHCLLDAGLSHRTAVRWLHCVSGIGSILGLIYLLTSGYPAAAVFLVTPLLVIGFFHVTGAARIGQMVHAVRKNRALRAHRGRHQAAFDHLQLQFAAARSFDHWWEQVCAAGQLLGFARVSVALANRDGSPRVLRWSNPSVIAPEPTSITFSVPVSQRRAGGPLPVEVALTGAESLEAAAQRVGMFFRLMEEHSLSRLPTEPTVSRLPAKPKPIYQNAGGLLEPAVEGLTAAAT
jgi:hypothetical protein